MPKFKDYTPKPNTDEEEELSDIGFRLYGEEFICAPKYFQSYKLLEFIHDTTSEDTTKTTGAVINFFKYVLTEEDHKRLLGIFNSEDKNVDMNTLMEIVNGIVEEYSERNPK